MLTKKLIAALLFAIAGGANAATISMTGSGSTIPDNVIAGVDFLGSNAGAGNISNISVSFTGLSHTFMGDLVMSLEHVGVTGPITFLNRRGGTRELSMVFGVYDPTTVYTFVANGAGLQDVSTITSLTGPGLAPGAYGSEAGAGDLVNFFGTSAAGSWRLNISDRAGIDLSNADWTWAINLTVPDQNVPVPGSIFLVIPGLAIGSRFLRRKPA